MNGSAERPLGLVMVVEDDPEINEIIATCLMAIGLKVLRAQDGEMALALLRCHRPDAIVTDIKMPRKNGIEFVQEMRAAGNEVPVVILTAFVDRENIQQVLRLGVVDLLEKPFRVEQLCETILRAVRLGRDLQETEEKLKAIWVQKKLSLEEWEKMRRLKLATMILRHDPLSLKLTK